MLKIVILLIIFSITNGNIWDNMYSHSEARHPIRVEESINFDFKIPQYSLIANLDFNRELGLVTLTTYFEAILLKI